MTGGPTDGAVPFGAPSPRALDLDARGACAAAARSGRRGRRSRVAVVFAGLILASLGVGVASLAIGAAPVPLDAVFTAVCGGEDSPEAYIVRSLRLPRALLGLGVGASLAVAGAVLQGLFRNPLADPSLLGVTGGAGAAVAVAFVGLGALGPAAGALGPAAAFGVAPVAAFAGALAATAAVFAIGRAGGRASVATMLLAGIAINALAGVVTGFCVFFADDARLRDMTFWALGGLGGASWELVAAVAPLLAVTVVAALALARPLDLLQLGEGEAHHLGLPVERVKVAAIILSALMVGLAVAAAGGVGFVGLVVPHLVRMLVGPRHPSLLPASALLGGALVVGADLVARTAAAPAELPLGLITALLGAPFFLGLLLARRRAEGG